MRFSTANRVHEVARAIEAEGGPKLVEINLGDPLVEDSDIDYGDDVSLQVGDSYVSVNRWVESEGTQYHVPVATSKEAARVLHEEIVKARAPEKPSVD